MESPRICGRDSRSFVTRLWDSRGMPRSAERGIMASARQLLDITAPRQGCSRCRSPARCSRRGRGGTPCRTPPTTGASTVHAAGRRSSRRSPPTTKTTRQLGSSPCSARAAAITSKTRRPTPSRVASWRPAEARTPACQWLTLTRAPQRPACPSGLRPLEERRGEDNSLPHLRCPGRLGDVTRSLGQRDRHLPRSYAWLEDPPPSR